MTRGTAIGANDRIATKRLACGPHAASAVGQMHPIQPVLLHKCKMVLDYDGNVVLMCDFPRQIGYAAQLCLVSCAAEAQAGNGKALERTGKKGAYFLCRKSCWRDKIELWKIGLRHFGRLSGKVSGIHILLCSPVPVSSHAPVRSCSGIVTGKPERPLRMIACRANAPAMMQNPVVILVRPQMGENIGAAARAMLNFGLTEMRLVAPRDGWPNPKAVAMASGAAGRVLDHARVYDNLADALQGLDAAYATTARGRDLIKPVYTPAEAMAAARSRTVEGGRVGLVFGAERSGLENEDIALATAIVTVPVNPEFASLNLAQAVLLMGYEWGREALPAQPAPHGRRPAGDVPASLVEIDALARHYEERLDAAGFFFPEQKIEGMKLTLRNMWSRLGMTRSDTEIFHGMLRRLTRRD